MGIGTPVSLGTVNTGTSGSSTYTITTGAAVQVGDLVIVGTAYDGSSTIAISSITDTAGNTYTRIQQSTSGTTQAELWYCYSAIAMASSSSINANWASALTGGTPAIAVLAARIPGVMITSPLDQSAQQAATTATPSVTTGALAIPNEIVFGLAYQGGTYTEASGYTNINGASTNGTTKLSYKTVNSTSAVTFAPTWSGAFAARTIIATFKAAPASGFNLAMMGM